MFDRLKLFLSPYDGRYEDLFKGSLVKNIFRDFTAGLIVAMVAIPLAMGFAMASGLKPEHGIVGGAIAGLIGALFGGSKYQVYGPTAAFIPVIAGLMALYGSTTASYEQGHGFLVICAIVAGILLMIMGLFGLGKYVSWVPHSIVVGFTIGIAATIALSQVGEVLGMKTDVKGSFFQKVRTVIEYFHEFNVYALALAAGTFLITKYLLRVSVFIPAPLIALGLCTALSTTILSDSGLTSVKAKYGDIPRNLLVFTPPQVPDGEVITREGPGGTERAYLLPGSTDPAEAVTRSEWYTAIIPFVPETIATPTQSLLVVDLIYFAFAILFVSAIESLLCSRMADRLANNQGQPFNPNKELWGQGWVQTVVPLINGFPHTGALARTATNIKLGAISPLAGIFKCVLKLMLAAFLANFLELVPMACIGGILMYVAFNMVKAGEVKEVLSHNWFHVGLMIYTAIMVILTDFLTGVLTAIILYAVLYRFLDRKPAPPAATDTSIPTAEELAASYGATSSQFNQPTDDGRPAAHRTEAQTHR
jgi:MFS superfamily sulfate permease-like transporter